MSTLSPNYFQHVKLSAVALLKLVMHACAGGRHEIQGVLLGKTEPHTFYVLDTIALPGLGTETRVNPIAEAYAYQYNYIETGRKVFLISSSIVQYFHFFSSVAAWMLMVGIIHILDLVVGCLVLMLHRKRLGNNWIPFLQLSSIPYRLFLQEEFKSDHSEHIPTIINLRSKLNIRLFP